MATEFRSCSRNSTLVLIIIAAATLATICVPTANAGRFEMRNELQGLKGSDRNLAVRCWSAHDRLGLTNLMPGQSRSWTFKTVRLWPLAYTEFRCELGTKFGLTKERDIIVFKADNSFLSECDKSHRDACIWVAKNDGVYLRKKSTWFGRDYYNDVRRTPWGRRSYLTPRRFY